MSKLLNQPPKYCKGAIASSKGWSHPKTGELLVSNKSLDLDYIEENFPDQIKKAPVRLTQEQKNQIEMDAMFDDVSVNDDVSADVETVEETEIIEPLIEQVEEEIINLEAMTKAELMAYAKDSFNVSLNKKDNKTTLIEKIKEFNE